MRPGDGDVAISIPAQHSMFIDGEALPSQPASGGNELPAFLLCFSGFLVVGCVFGVVVGVGFESLPLVSKD